VAIYLPNALLFLVTGSVSLKKGAYLAFIVCIFAYKTGKSKFI
jgi:hypothetical protein